MIVGSVTPYREPVIDLGLYDVSGQATITRAIVDTGFTDFLTLPTTVILALGLAPAGSMRVALAHGSEINLQSHLGDVLWDGQRRTVMVLEADGDPLVGMAMLYGYELYVHVVDGGRVTIDRRP